MPTINIPISKLKNHPRNVRKELGNLDELTESIKQQGIFQNLTVVKEEDTDGYLVVIGNRRLLAAKRAGLTSLPCVVVEMNEKDQVATMLLENMQRSDLTIFEQAQGFQQCLDLGIQEVELTKKTGLSNKTIKHRLELAKINKDILKNKTNDFSFSLTSLYELEKIKDTKEREKILQESRSDNDLIFKIKNFIEQDAKKQNEEILKYAILQAGIPHKSEMTTANLYGDIEILNKSIPRDKKLDVDKTVDEIKKYAGEDVYWKEQYSGICLMKVDREFSRLKEENSRNEEEQYKKEEIMKNLFNSLSEKAKIFFELLKKGEISLPKGKDDLEEEIFETIAFCGVYCHDEKEIEELQKYPLKVRKILLLENNIKNNLPFVSYKLFYHKVRGLCLQKFCSLLEKLGFDITSEEKRMIDGTHDFYHKKEEE